MCCGGVGVCERERERESARSSWLSCCVCTRRPASLVARRRRVGTAQPGALEGKLVVAPVCGGLGGACQHPPSQRWLLRAKGACARAGSHASLCGHTGGRPHTDRAGLLVRRRAHCPMHTRTIGAARHAAPPPHTHTPPWWWSGVSPLTQLVVLTVAGGTSALAPLCCGDTECGAVGRRR